MSINAPRPVLSETGGVDGPLLAVAFFALQVVANGWWLRRYRYGPAAWLWRSHTYWRLQPMRRDA